MEWGMYKAVSSGFRLMGSSEVEAVSIEEGFSPTHLAVHRQ